MRFLVILPALLASLSPVAAQPAKPTAEAIEFFEKKVRPVLAEHCYSCHGAKKQQGGLRLDTAEGVRKGTDGEPVVLPGDAAKSRLIAAIRRAGDYPMPPSKPLPNEAVAALTEWVKIGAPLPANDGVQRVDPLSLGKSHWAFQPVKEPQVPSPKSQVSNPIDAFLLAKLEAKGLSFSAPADKRTLIRRVYFDLIGLPPTAEEVEAFEKNVAPDAFARVVDKLLASPHYGERWGRHWLDVARYADSKGYNFTEERAYPYAYTYRDYVIRSFNEDKPYDQFLIEQLAADKLPARADNKHLAALGFLTVGRRFMNNIHDIIDDRLDATFRGLMGLTVSCARCHDHKFDPIPIADYYSLYGVFAGSVEPKELPPLEPNDRSPERLAFEAEYEKKRKAAEDFSDSMYASHLAKFRTADAVADYLAAARDARGKTAAQIDALATERKLDPILITRWRDYLGEPARKTDTVFAPWLAVADIPANEFGGKGPATLRRLLAPGSPTRVHPTLADALKNGEPDTLQEVAEVYGKVLADATRAANPDPILAKVLAPDGGGPTDLPVMLADKFVPIPIKKQFRALRNAADRFRVESPSAPGRAMVLSEMTNPPQPVVFLRGNHLTRGPVVPRQFLAIASGPERKPFTDGSGRLELAKAIASPENPLTARVMANRIWMHHFGQGLVRTPSDFGVRSEPPTHPELLDWLAKRFVEDGWSVKSLHRRILLSAAYRQGSNTNAALAQADPENRLLSRQARQRLEFEPLRDSMLNVSGKLDATVYGRSVQLFAAPFSSRRAVYGFVDRQNLPGTFRVFDFASPDQHTPQRFLTTVPQQALFLMNSPFVADQAKAVAARPEVAKATEPGEKVRRIYRAVLSRNPTTAETALAKEFLTGMPAKPEGGKLGEWELFAQVLLLSNEFAFVD